METPLQFVQGFESLQSDFKHYISVLSGFETLHEETSASSDYFPHPEDMSDDMKTAVTVLKLNDIDLESTVGTESFIDTVKKGAKQVKEWIKALIKSIREYFFGKKTKYDTAKKLEKLNKQKGDNLINITNKDIDKAITDVTKITKKLDEKINDRNKLNEELDQVLEAIDAELDAGIGEVALKANNYFDKCKTILSELDKVDSTGESRELLGLNKDWGKDLVKPFTDLTVNDHPRRVVGELEKLIRITDKVIGDLESATKKLDVLNEAGKGHESEEGHKLSRAAKVLQCVANVSDVLQNIVINTSGAIEDKVVKARHKVTKDILSHYVNITSPAAKAYLDKMLADM